GIAAAPLDKHCIACHQQIHEGTFARGDRAANERWRSHITSMRFAPSLANADRLRRSWVRDFLLAPYDVRPGLVAQMPRLAIRRPEAERLAAHLTSEHPEPIVVGDAARGEMLYRALACARCHRFTGANVDDVGLYTAGRNSLAGWALAPDLRQA